ncbi:hypothetical protein KY360_05060 [Candidatus Woesearchaeota archaeon]|nr:hypothetical protein [Candidatus Woesearchaeota archaeon]
MRGFIIFLLVVGLLFYAVYYIVPDIGKLKFLAQDSTEVRNKVEETITNQITSGTKDLTIESRAVVDSNSKREFTSGVKNNQGSKATFQISGKCVEDVNLISPKTVAVEAGQVETFKLEINAQGVPAGRHRCSVNAKSDQGDDYTKWIEISVK